MPAETASRRACRFRFVLEAAGMRLAAVVGATMKVATTKLATVGVAGVSGVEIADMDIAEVNVADVDVSAVTAKPHDRQKKLTDDKRPTDDRARQK
jgi:hypothetical protein